MSNTKNTVTVSKNAAGTAWVVYDGIVQGMVGALNILTFCRTRKEALAWCEVHGLSA